MTVVEIFVPIDAAHYPDQVRALAAQAAQVTVADVVHHTIQKRSIDARQRTIKVRLQVAIYTDNNEILPQNTYTPPAHSVQQAPEIAIVGAGSAGLFAAMRLIALGYKPILIERGKDVRSRRRDLAAITRHGIVNPESNYCFGEGGAGTYSDGKLYTRSNKRGDVHKILDIFVHFGANTDIKIDAHPHIGTNKLPNIIAQMRAYILAHGGEVHFDSKLTHIFMEFGAVIGIEINHQIKIKCPALILATGHSARDIFELLHHQKIEIIAKPFALGVRIEHPQTLIDTLQYRTDIRHPLLPPASYNMVAQAGGRGVYSFCMCPGGIIAPCATAPNEIVTNGWSPSKRNNPFANSGLVVELQMTDFKNHAKRGALAALDFQAMVERRAFEAGGGNLVAPAQRAADFLAKKTSATLPDCSYQCGTKSVDLHTVLPTFVAEKLHEGLQIFKKQKPNYLHPEALMVGVESRTSAPVRIPRHPQTLMHTQIAGLFPCGEGAGYAGGIVSAAIDGERCAEAAVLFLG